MWNKMDLYDMSVNNMSIHPIISEFLYCCINKEKKSNSEGIEQNVALSRKQQKIEFVLLNGSIKIASAHLSLISS